MFLCASLKSQQRGHKGSRRNKSVLCDLSLQARQNAGICAIFRLKVFSLVRSWLAAGGLFTYQQVNFFAAASCS